MEPGHEPSPHAGVRLVGGDHPTHAGPEPIRLRSCRSVCKAARGQSGHHTSGTFSLGRVSYPEEIKKGG